MSPNHLAWSPPQFWGSTLAEMNMALEALRGEFQSGPVISRERVAEIVKAFGARKSIRT